MSKKGFKKLEEHEMKSFGDGDSGSETELYLGPSATSIRSRGWYSWCLLLYVVLLTILILMLCVFMAFMAYTMKVIADNCSSVETRLDGVKDDLTSFKDASSHSGKGFVAELRSLNRSLLKLESTYDLSHQQMELSMDGLVNRVGILEVNRQDGTPSIGVEQLFKEVASLNSSIRQLVGSSGDTMKAMDSITTAINSYDSQLRDLHRDHGDLSSNQATLGAAVDGIRGSLADLQAEVNALRDSALERNRVVHQSMEQLALQLAQLEAAVGVLNQSLGHEPATSSTNMPVVHHMSSEVPLPSATVPPATQQPSLKPEQNMPSFTISSSSPAPPSTTTSSSSSHLTASTSLHSHSSQMDMLPQPTPSLAGNSSVVSIVGPLTTVLAPLPQTPVPPTFPPGNTSSGTTAKTGNGTGTNSNTSVVRQEVESGSVVPSSIAATPSPSDWETTFNTTDADGNGKLSASEFHSSFGDDGDAIFPMLDKNGDHYITRDELMSAFMENQLP
eukprot:Em0011g261a